jgi:hypothetical protein
LNCETNRISMKHLSIFKLHTFDIKMNKPTDRIYIRPFGDVHRDAHSCDVERWKWFLKKSKEDPNAENTYYLGMGDYHDFASYSEGKKLQSIGLHETTLINIEEMVERRNREFAKEIEHMRGRLIGLIGGNHTWITDGKSSDEDLAERMGCAYLGWLSIIRLRINMRANITFDVFIFACHGLGGGRVLGSSVRKVEDLFHIFPRADIFIMGHDHQRSAAPQTRLIHRIGNGGEWQLKQQRQFYCRSGSFMKSYSPNESGYATGKLMRPADLGTICGVISGHRDCKDGKDKNILDIEFLV